jgi:hypothetical protein
MIGRFDQSTLLFVHTAFYTQSSKWWRSPDMIDPEPHVTPEGTSPVVPPAIESAFWALVPKDILKAPAPQFFQRSPLLRVETNLPLHLIGIVDISGFGGDVKISG